MTKPIFDEFNILYRSIISAVPEGRGVRLRILLPRDIGCSAAYLAVREDGGEYELNGMFWAGMEGDSHEWWDITFCKEKAGLYWYRFECDTSRGRLIITEKNGAAAFADDGYPWQQTVYQKDFSPPEWFSGGVMYQIFPDRFAHSGAAKKDVPDDRILRDDWGGQPDYLPDKNGIILNNDYFGGDLKGIEEKLDYIKSLGVSVIYLNPVFEAHSNHRYDTADYGRIDPLLGGEEDLRSLCVSAAKRGISIILDGVFSHTGADSIYFNKKGRYPGPGAYQSRESKYFDWYTFESWPDTYKCWWDILILPQIKSNDPDFIEFITGKDGIARKWLRAGVKGFRLDVADELSDEFLDALYKAVKEEDSEAVIISEVWEDASNKISYGRRRRYLLGGQTDSVMNYPFDEAALDFVRGGGSEAFFRSVMGVVSHYPPGVLHSLMNHVGTHDTERALTAIAGEPANGRGRDWQAAQQLTPEQRARGLKLMRLASAIQYTLPGVPCLYYGDEAGLEGYRDPFNRMCYPWGGEDKELIEWYQYLGELRKDSAALKNGDFMPLAARQSVLAYARLDRKTGEHVICAVNQSDEPQTVSLPDEYGGEITLPALGAVIKKSK